MSKRVLILFFAAFGLSLLFVLLQSYNIVRIKRELDATKNQCVSLQEYVCSSFVDLRQESESQVIDISLSCLTDSSVVVYIPTGVCRACFTILLFALQDHSIDYNKVLVLSEVTDFEIKSACTARNIRYYVLNNSIDGLNDIYVTRLFKGVIPLTIRYNLDRDYEFSLFMSDRIPYSIQ